MKAYISKIMWASTVLLDLILAVSKWEEVFREGAVHGVYADDPAFSPPSSSLKGISGFKLGKLEALFHFYSESMNG